MTVAVNGAPPVAVILNPQEVLGVARGGPKEVMGLIRVEDGEMSRRIEAGG